jgi:hypothetical protein
MKRELEERTFPGFFVVKPWQKQRGKTTCFLLELKRKERISAAVWGISFTAKGRVLNPQFGYEKVGEEEKLCLKLEEGLPICRALKRPGSIWAEIDLMVVHQMWRRRVWTAGWFVDERMWKKNLQIRFPSQLLTSV